MNLLESSPTPSLREQLGSGRIVVAPGVYDALGAAMARAAGFQTLYLSGASLAYTRLASPDIGLLGLTEVGESLRAIRERTSARLIVDADTGFGNAINVMRTVRLLESAGADAIQLEDQGFPKRCGHLRGKSLVSEAEMVGKLRAAVDARRSADTLIIGRTDAIAVDGIEAALERAERYVEAGADILFVEGIRHGDDLAQVMARFRGRVPIMANMVEGGDTPLQTASELGEAGFSLVIFPGALVRAFAHMAERFFASLAQAGTTRPFWPEMLDFKQLNELLGTAELLAMGQRYAPESQSAPASVQPIERT